MKIAAWMETFPALSETYILWHMAELLRDGVDVSIFAARRGDTSRVHEEVEELDMLARVQAPPAIDTRQAKATLAADALVRLSGALARHPDMLLRLLPHVSGAKNIGWFQAVLHLAALEAPQRFDILQCYFGPSARRAALMRRIGAVNGALVASFLGFDLNVLGQRLGGDYYAHVFERAERITVASAFMRRKLLELGAPEERAVILPLGLPVARFTFKPREAPASGPVRIVTAARLTEVKGIAWGMRGVAQAVAKGAELRWDILGDGPLRAELEALRAELRLEEVVHFHGAQPMHEVRALLDVAHLSMLPGVRAQDGAEEALGGAVIEAQACGLPVLTTDAGGIAEGMRDGVSGLCVAQREPEAIAQGLLWLIDQASRWPEMGAAGRAHVEQSYDCHRLHARWMALYHAL